MRPDLRRSTKPARPHRLPPTQIDRLRDSYVETIATARKCDTGPNAFLDTAQKLLTSSWGQASWASRASILKSVEWLLQAGIGKGRTDDTSVRPTRAHRLPVATPAGTSR